LEEKNISRILSEIKRVLKPSGILFITTPNSLRPGLRFGKIENKPDGFGHGHEHEYNLSEVKKMAADADFKLIEADTVSFYSGVGKGKGKTYFYPLAAFPRHRNKKRNFAKLLAYPLLSCVPRWRDSIYLVLKK